MKFGRYDYASFAMFAAYAVGSVALPVTMVQVADELGFTIKAGGTVQGGWLHMMRSVSICATLAASGFVSGRWGNRRPLGWALLAISAGLWACSAAPSYAVLMAAFMVAGLGEGVVEGLGTPFVQELHPEEPARHMNFSHGFWSLGVLAATLLFGWLMAGGVAWRCVFMMAALFALLPMALLLFPRGRHGRPMERPARVDAAGVAARAAAIFRRPRFWLFSVAMLLAGGGEYCLTFWVASFVQDPDFFKGSVMAGGAGTAVFAAGMFAGRMGFGVLLRQSHLKGLMIAAGALGIASCMVIPWLAASALPWKLHAFFAVLFFAGIATAPFWPSLQTHAVDRLPGLDATMVYVLLSCAGVPGCGIFTLFMGWLARENRLGMANSFYIVPACFAGIIALLLLDRMKRNS